MEPLKKKAIVLLSGGMDSAICLGVAIKKWGKKNILAVSFNYQQRHGIELQLAKKRCHDQVIDHQVIDLSVLTKITENSLVNHQEKIDRKKLNTMVIGRNGLMAMITGIKAYLHGAEEIYLGVMELEIANSGYRDCSRHYMDLIEKILKIDLNQSNFQIQTPLIYMSKLETLELAHKLKLLPELFENTISCYQGVLNYGCGHCPACLLRNSAIKEFIEKYPRIHFSYRHQFK